MEEGSDEREDADENVREARGRKRREEDVREEVVERRARIDAKGRENLRSALPGDRQREDLVGPEGPDDEREDAGDHAGRDRRPRERTHGRRTRADDRFHGALLVRDVGKRLTPESVYNVPFRSTKLETPILERLSQHRLLAGAPPDQIAWLAARGQLIRLDAGDRARTEGHHRARPVHRPFRPHVDPRRPGRRTAKGHGVAGRRRDGFPAVLAPRQVAGRREGRGADRDLDDPARGDPGADSRVLRAHRDLRARHGRPRPPVHVERPSGGKDVLPRQARGGARARAEQPRVGGRAERPGAQGAVVRGRSGVPRARRGTIVRGAAGRRRQSHEISASPRPARRSGARPSSGRTARTPSPTGWRATAPTSPPPKRWRSPRSRSTRSTSSRKSSRRGAPGDPPVARGRLRDVPAGVGNRDGRVPDPQPRRGGEGLHLHGPGDDAQAGGRRPGAGRHARGAQREGPREIREREPRRRGRSSARPGVRRRAQPGVGEPRRQRAGRGEEPRRRRGGPSGLIPSSCASSTTDRDCPRRSASASSIPSSRRSRSARAPASASTSRGASSAGTTERSRSTPAPGTREFRVTLPIDDGKG